MQHTITADTIQYFCRSCLNEIPQPPLYNIQGMDVEIRHWLQDSTIQKPPINDSLPMFVCQLCRDKLECFLEFHQMCSRSRKILQNILEKSWNNRPVVKSSTTCGGNEMTVEELADVVQVNCDWLEFDFVAIPKSLAELQSKTYKQEVAEKEETTFCSISPKKEDSTDSYGNNTDDAYSPTPPDQQIKAERQRNSNSNEQPIKREVCTTTDISSDELSANVAVKTIKPKTKPKSKRKPQRQRKEKSISDETPQHVCEECGKIYKTLVKLIEHQYSHKPLEEYPFHCTETDCSKAFKTRSSFQEHKLRHAGIKNFQCHLCEMKKTSKKELDIHINYHTKERQWLCPKCSMIFYSANDFRSHDKIVHLRIRRFSCRYCDQAFAKNYALKHHEMRHTGEKPNICSECGKGFIQMVSLRTHMKTHNKLLANAKTAASIAKTADKYDP